jgi:hypothetical protein
MDPDGIAEANKKGISDKKEGKKSTLGIHV